MILFSCLGMCTCKERKIICLLTIQILRIIAIHDLIKWNRKITKELIHLCKIIRNTHRIDGFADRCLFSIYLCLLIGTQLILQCKCIFLDISICIRRKSKVCIVIVLSINRENTLCRHSHGIDVCNGWIADCNCACCNPFDGASEVLTVVTIPDIEQRFQRTGAGVGTCFKTVSGIRPDNLIHSFPVRLIDRVFSCHTGKFTILVSINKLLSIDFYRIIICTCLHVRMFGIRYRNFWNLCWNNRG